MNIILNLNQLDKLKEWVKIKKFSFEGANLLYIYLYFFTVSFYYQLFKHNLSTCDF